MYDEIINEIIKIDRYSKITMTVHGDTNTFKFVDNPEEHDFELYILGNPNKVYGLSCCSVIEVIGVLIQDYANGIISYVKVH
jgi:hypothetical protein